MANSRVDACLHKTLLWDILPAMENRYDIQAIAIDLDGTLLTSNKTISDCTIRTLKYVMDRGIHVSIATGRGLVSSLRYVEQVGTEFPAVCYNGSCIYDFKNHRDLWHIQLPEEVCRTIVSLSFESSAHLHAFMDHTLYYTEAGRRADYLDPESHSSGTVVDFHDIHSFSFTKAMFIGSFEETERIRSILHDRYGDTLHTVYSHEHYFEIMTGGATKGTALERLMHMYGIGSHQVMAFGDADNDKEMLAWAKYSFAMENAHDSVKSVASGTAAHNDDHGVANKIQHMFGFSLD